MIGEMSTDPDQTAEPPLEQVSLHDRQEEVEPHLVHRIHFGLRLAFYAVIATGVLIPLLMVFMVLLMETGVEFSQSASTALQVLLAFLSGVLTFIGWNLITTPVPAMRESYRLSSIRGWLLGLIAFAVVLGVVSAFTLNIEGAGINAVSIRDSALSTVVWVIGQLATAALFLLKTAYLRRLASFVPDDRLVGRFGDLYRYARALLVLTVVLVTLAVTVSLLTEGGSRIASIISAASFGFVFLATFVFVILYLVPLYRLGTRYRTLRRRAEEAGTAAPEQTDRGVS